MLSPQLIMSQNNNKFYAVYMGLEMGFLIALPLVGFLILGVFLDKKFQTAPLFLILSVFLGFISVVLEIKHYILPFLEKGRKSK